MYFIREWRKFEWMWLYILWIFLLVYRMFVIMFWRLGIICWGFWENCMYNIWDIVIFIIYL